MSHETIYLHIWQDKKQNGTLYQYFARKQRCRRKRVNKIQIINKISMEQRPEVANNIERFVDFELDTIIGSNHKGAILTLVDSKTLFIKLVLLEGKNEIQLSELTIKTLYDFKPYLHTITSDNGKEFAKREHIKNSSVFNINLHILIPVTNVAPWRIPTILFADIFLKKHPLRSKAIKIK